MRPRRESGNWRPEGEVHRLAEQEPLPEWVARLDRLVFGEAWSGLSPHEALWVIPELAFARWSRVPAAGEAELLRIAVAPEAQGQGHGRVLLEACQRDLTGEGLVHLFLEVRPTNASALRLYEACGWELCGRRHRYYTNGEDALLFQRVD